MLEVEMGQAASSSHAANEMGQAASSGHTANEVGTEHGLETEPKEESGTMSVRDDVRPHNGSAAVVGYSHARLRHRSESASSRELGQLSTEDLATLSTAVNEALVDVSAINRKYAMQTIVRILTIKNLSSLQSASSLLDSLCLSVSLNVLSPDPIAQACALAGLRSLCDFPTLIPAIVKAEADRSISRMLQRPSSSDEALRTGLRVLRSLSEANAFNVETAQLGPGQQKQNEEVIRGMLALGQRLGGVGLEHSLVIVSRIPLDRYGCYQDVWDATKRYLLNQSKPARLVVAFAGLIGVRENQFLRDIAVNDTVLNAFIRCSDELSVLTALLACGKFLNGVSESSGTVKQKLIVDTFLTGLSGFSAMRNHLSRAMCELVESSPSSWSSCLEMSNAMEVYTGLFSSSDQIDCETIQNFLSLGLAHAMQPCIESDGRRKKRREYFQFAGNWLTSSQEVNHLASNTLRLQVQLGLALADDATDTPGTLQLVLQALGHTESSFIRASGARLLAIRMKAMGGWIRAGLLGGDVGREWSPLEIETAFDREEAQDENEKHFIWAWNPVVLTHLKSLFINGETIMEKMRAMEALFELVQVEGPDRVDGLVLQASWEGLHQQLPVNTASPDRFCISTQARPVHVLSSPKEMRAGVYKNPDDSIVVLSKKQPERESSIVDNEVLKGWTITMWIKQLGAITSEPMRSRTIVGTGKASNQGQDDDPMMHSSSNDAISSAVHQPGSFLGLDDQLMLGFQPPVPHAMFRSFGAWEQLSSGWHHIIVTCKEHKNLTGLDLLLGKSRLISCYVDGSRLGVPIACTPLECPSLENGIVLGNDCERRSHLGAEFALGELRVFSTCLSERIIASSVARSSFNRRPNWNISALGDTRFTPAHVWARLQLTKDEILVRTLVQMIPSEDGKVESKQLLAVLMLEYLGTVPLGREMILQSGVINSLESLCSRVEWKDQEPVLMRVLTLFRSMMA